MISISEELYECDLRIVAYELLDVNVNLIEDLVEGNFEKGSFSKILADEYLERINELEFELYVAVLEDLLHKSLKHEKELRSLIADTSEMTKAIARAKKQRVKAENLFHTEERFEESIDSIKSTIEGLHNVFVESRANRSNIRRKAILKLVGVLGSIWGVTGTIFSLISRFVEMSLAQMLALLGFIILLETISFFLIISPQGEES